MKLQLEVREQEDLTQVFAGGRSVAIVAPLVNEDYWMFRVRLSQKQAVVGFPKIGTIGIGFAVEDEDWNRNLPYQSTTDEIAAWIACNKGDDSISDEDVILAVSMVQGAARLWKEGPR